MIDEIKQFILDLIFPMKCAVCGKKSDKALCFECVGKSRISESADACLFCEKESFGNRTCDKCLKRHFLGGLSAVSDYANPVINNLVKFYKYDEMADLESYFQYLVFKFFKNNKPSFLFWDKESAVIIPVPLYYKKEKSRGFNQSKTIAGFLREILALDIINDVLIRTKDKTPQAKIDDKNLRKENIKDVYACQNADLIKGKNIILVDDVSTTGSTLDECARILKQAGVNEVWGFVVAKG